MKSATSLSEDAASQSLAERASGDYWEALIGARSAEQLCSAWLPILCTMIPTAQCGLLLLKDSDGSFVPAATWPEGADLGHLRGVAEETLNSRRGAASSDRPGTTQIGYPLSGGDELLGAVILDLNSATPDAVSQAMRQLHWGAGWLMELHNRRNTQQLGVRLERSAYLLDLVLTALAESDWRKTALAIVNRLAQRFACHQVQFGVEKGKTVRVEAISQSAWFDEKANLINLAAVAMNEAFDQRSLVVFPEREGGGSLITQAHRRYAEESRSAELCSIPLVAGAKVVGVWLLERDEPFSGDELESLEALALALAPIVELKQACAESLPAHAKRSAEHGLRRLTDTSHPGMKLIAGCAVLLLAILAFVEIDYRVSAIAVIEGAIQRATVAPFDGYIQSAPAKAGDLVQAGQVLATLEDKDLLLERARWQAEHEVSQRKALEAMAKGDRVELGLASAQADQALAQLNLVLEKLSRVKVAAPFDGVVVRGDLSQQIGSPVELGKVLFEVSPLAAWRVIVKVDERDITHVREGMGGQLMLTSLPSESYPLMVSKVTPVATAEDGRNYFRVETSLTGATPALRPNMEGVAKLTAGQRSVLWIWTHRLTDWLRVTAWKLMP
jgi:multidrug resistance efflux pump